MAANINIDGINIWGKTRDVTVIGLGKSSLDAIIERAAAAQNRVVKPDQLSDRGFFYRSDQFNFAKLGVPSAYFGSGMDFVGKPSGWGKQQREKWEETNYHQVNDELDGGWDFAGAVDDCLLYYRLGFQVANTPAAPTWKKGDEFEGPRLKALETLSRGGKIQNK
jgi:Zn-dependent M28 family amino/carboxypeptidase